MSVSTEKKGSLADPGTGLWLSYSIDRPPAPAVLRRFALAAPLSEEAPAVRDRIFNSELRSVTQEVIAHRQGPVQPRPAAPVENREIPTRPAPAVVPTLEVAPAPARPPAGAVVIIPEPPSKTAGTPAPTLPAAVPAPVPVPIEAASVVTPGPPLAPLTEITPGEGDTFEFPDRLDDAEDVRSPAAGSTPRVAQVRIEDNGSDFFIGENDRDEIELEDPEENNGPVRPPEPVATDLTARRSEPRGEANSPDEPAIPPGRSARAYQADAEQKELETVQASVSNQIESELERPAVKSPVRSSSTPGTTEFPALPLEKIQDLLQNIEYAYPREFIEIFRTVYSGRPFEARQLDPVLKFLLEKSRASAIAWLALDRRLSAFRPYLQMGLDVNTRKNLYFGLHDRYLPEDEKYEMLRFDGSLKQDFHFRKRFSTPFLQSHQGAIIINLTLLRQAGYIMLFYRRLPDPDLIEQLDKSSLPIVRDILPAVQRLQEAEEVGLRSESNFQEQLFHLCREMTNFGKTPLRIIHFQFPGLLARSSRHVLLEKLGGVLKQNINPDERVVTMVPGRMVLLLKKSDETRVVETARDVCDRWGIELKTTSRFYPDPRANLITLLEPPRLQAPA